MHTQDNLPKVDDSDDNAGKGLTFEVLEDEVSDTGQVQRHKGIYLIPNAATCIAFLCGFFSIIQSSHGKFEHAIIAIFLAGFFDAMDGRLARKFNAQSAFGEQFDSLSDLVSFGVAPAFLIYCWALEPLGRMGIAATFIYAVCAALRLARFNVQVGSVDSRFFVGLPSPTAAATVASLAWVGIYYPNLAASLGHWLPYVVAGWVVLVGFLMVSNIKYISFKQLERRRVPFVLLLPFILLLSLLLNDIPIGMLVICVVYIAYGLLEVLVKPKAG